MWFFLGDFLGLTYQQVTNCYHQAEVYTPEANQVNSAAGISTKNLWLPVVTLKKCGNGFKWSLLKDVFPVELHRNVPPNHVGLPKVNKKQTNISRTINKNCPKMTS